MPARSSDHTVGLSMMDAAGNSSTDSWTFHVQSVTDATFSAKVPAPGSSVTVEPRALSVTASSVSNLLASSAKLFVDGVPVTTAATPASGPSIVVSGATSVLAPGTHTVRVEVTDAVGHTTSNTWSFTATAVPTCTACHTGYPTGHKFPAPSDACGSGCHDKHTPAPGPANLSGCGGIPCHEGAVHGAEKLTGYACTDCHTPAWPAVPVHTGTQLTSAHVTSTTGCEGCHSTSLTTEHTKSLGTIPLQVQPEVYAGEPALYTSKANMLAGTLSNRAQKAGVTPLQGAITAQCTVCHAQYAVGEETINANYLNPELFQPGSWATANGATTRVVVGTTAAPVTVLPGYPGITYTTATGGSAGSLIMAYKNHPLKIGGEDFLGAGASANFASAAAAGAGMHVSEIGSSVCQSCHNAPELVVVGGYAIQSFPHYTPGYYKFMAAQDQSLFDTPATLAEFANGRQAFFNSGFGTGRAGRPAVMNDGYCLKCHSSISTAY
jgi:hypothetical protein